MSAAFPVEFTSDDLQDDDAFRAITEAKTIARDLGMFATPADAGDCDVMAAIEELAITLNPERIREADAALERSDELIRRPVRVVVDTEAALPSDQAFDRYEPEIEAAYYLGFVVGLRLARAIGHDDEKGGA